MRRLERRAVVPRAASCASKRGDRVGRSRDDAQRRPVRPPRARAHALSSGVNSAPPSGTASIAPAGSACISRPRAATSASASSSENTPARHAATYSPTLWPISAAGRMPQRYPQLRERVLDDEQRRLRELRLRVSAPSASSVVAGVNRAARADRDPRCGIERPRSTRSTSARNDGLVVVEVARHAAYCAPWPLNMNTTTRAASLERRVSTRRSSACASASTRRRRRRGRRRTRRWAKARRPTCSV